MMKKILAVILSLALLAPNVALAAAPAIDGSADSAQTTNSATHTVTLADASCAVGELHIAMIGIDGQSGLTGSWGSSFVRPTGLSGLLLDSTGSEFTAAALDVAYQIDADDVSVVYTITGGTERSAHIAICVSGWDEVDNPVIATVLDNNDPPSVDFGGTCDALIVTGVIGDDGQVASAAPSGYTGTFLTRSSGGTNGGASIAVAAAQVTAATSADPGAFTTPAGSDAYMAFTLAILNDCTGSSSDSSVRRRHGA